VLLLRCSLQRASAKRVAWQRLVDERRSLLLLPSRIGERGRGKSIETVSAEPLWSRLDLILRAQSHGYWEPGQRGTHGICLLKFENLAYKDTSSLIV